MDFILKIYQFLEYCHNNGIILSVIITLLGIYINLWKKYRTQCEQNVKELNEILRRNNKQQEEQYKKKHDKWNSNSKKDSEP